MPVTYGTSQPVVSVALLLRLLRILQKNNIHMADGREVSVVAIDTDVADDNWPIPNPVVYVEVALIRPVEKVYIGIVFNLYGQALIVPEGNRAILSKNPRTIDSQTATRRLRRFVTSALADYRKLTEKHP